MRRNFPSRPTTDFAKENLFNILGNRYDLEGLHVLDLFAGTGSISYEFASRGAHVELVEKDPRSLGFIRDTVRELNFSDIRVIRADVFKILPKLSGPYDLIFADPPYNMRAIDTLPELIAEHKLLREGGIFILEHPREYNFAAHPGFRELRTYGSVNFSLFA